MDAFSFVDIAAVHEGKKYEYKDNCYCAYFSFKTQLTISFMMERSPENQTAVNVTYHEDKDKVGVVKPTMVLV